MGKRVRLGAITETRAMRFTVRDWLASSLGCKPYDLSIEEDSEYADGRRRFVVRRDLGERVSVHAVPEISTRTGMVESWLVTAEPPGSTTAVRLPPDAEIRP